MRIYRWTLSPAKTFLFGPLGGCRFEPSCSEYALEAVRQHGALAGSWLALKRIGRCHPWGGCGHDPVPQRQSPTPANSGFHQLVGGGFPRLDILHWLDFSRVSSGFRVFHRSGKQLPPGH